LETPAVHQKILRKKDVKLILGGRITSNQQTNLNIFDSLKVTQGRFNSSPHLPNNYFRRKKYCRS